METILMKILRWRIALDKEREGWKEKKNVEKQVEKGAWRERDRINRKERKLSLVVGGGNREEGKRGNGEQRERGREGGEGEQREKWGKQKKKKRKIFVKERPRKRGIQIVHLTYSLGKTFENQINRFNVWRKSFVETLRLAEKNKQKIRFSFFHALNFFFLT